ncbi:MAG: DEAD/DEAH box helicase [Burkholderiales bacterium]|nr:MAG: DEAD/DEAH box helicase [Betaproteobacteria bacterium]TAG28954.1 MAG: DEAD/DEAH box helicase [Burkholderiales bacterium]TAG45838.1 MAG: DEAD/DEAH box helicase [Betaproteobacteria bacterium]
MNEATTPQHLTDATTASAAPAAPSAEVVAVDATPAPVTFASLNLAEPILRAVTESGYTTPTPIQAQAIPVVLAGLDVMGGAQTGTGKTAAFTLPILNRMLKHANSSPSPARHPVRALMLAPTRELAIQIEESVETYAKHTGLRSTVVFGGVDIKEQKAAVRAGVEILVATPGRLLDHIEQKNLSLNHVEVLVLDEADRMLDMGFIPDIVRIIGMLPQQRQSLLFSATFSEEIKRLADRMLKAPVLIEVARRNESAANVTQQIYRVSGDDKRRLLGHLVTSQDLKQVLVFSRSKLDTARLARALERDGFTTGAIHGDKSQDERMKALEAFKNGEIRILVATDVAARGIDIDQLPTVVNYEMPFVAEDYVHRIGRTGRAGASGTAISFVSSDDGRLLAEVEKLIKRKIDEMPMPNLSGYGDRYAPRSAPRDSDRDGGRAGSRRSGEGYGEVRPPMHEPRKTNFNGGRDKSHFDLNPDQPASRSVRPALPGRKVVREVCILLTMPVKAKPPADEATAQPLQRHEPDHLAQISA